MHHYQEGYKLYKDACEKHGIEYLDFHFYTLQLTKDQLNAFNEATLYV